jgi:NADH-quinone oxidoreductase subunit L
MDYSYTLLILILPLASFLVLGLFSKRMPVSLSGWVGTTGLFFIAALSLATAYTYYTTSGGEDGYIPVVAYNQVWLPLTDKLIIHLGILLDPLSVMMLVVITLVSAMVHLYSIGYMKGEKGYTRYFAFLSLFTFSMLGLVVATNIFQMYIFWELVGVSSYLLIGFYYQKLPPPRKPSSSHGSPTWDSSLAS